MYARLKDSARHGSMTWQAWLELLKKPDLQSFELLLQFGVTLLQLFVPCAQGLLICCRLG